MVSTGRRQTSSVSVIINLLFKMNIARPAAGVQREGGSMLAEEGVDLLGAACSEDTGNKMSGECGKRLSDSSWASEDLSCRSEVRREAEAGGGGSPERTGAADSHRAISLDASECLAEMSDLSLLVRSTALEDLTSIGDRRLFQGEEVVPEQVNGGPTVDDAASKSCSDSGTTDLAPDVTPPPPEAQRLSQSAFDPHSEDLHPANSGRDGSPRTETPSDKAAENRACDSRPDICNGSERSCAAELPKTPPHSSPARKSMVPVAIFKGLFALMFTRTSPLQFSPPTCLISSSFYRLLCSTLPLSPFSGR